MLDDTTQTDTPAKAMAIQSIGLYVYRSIGAMIEAGITINHESIMTAFKSLKPQARLDIIDETMEVTGIELDDQDRMECFFEIDTMVLTTPIIETVFNEYVEDQQKDQNKLN